MKEYLYPAFQILTGLGFLISLMVTLKARSVLQGTAPRLMLFALLMMPLGFFFMASAGQNSSLNKASPMLLASGGAFFAAAIFMGLGLFLMARVATEAEGSSK